MIKLIPNRFNVKRNRKYSKPEWANLMKLLDFLSDIRVVTESIDVASAQLFAYIAVLAEAYDAAPSFDPRVKPGYDALIRSNDKFLKQIKSKVRVNPTRNDPYQGENPETQMAQDIRKNRNLNIYAGDSEHPMFNPDQNVDFRTVHDFLAHYAPVQKQLNKWAGRDGKFLTHGFNGRGEINAYLTHAKIAPKAALPVLFTEVLGQYAQAYITGRFGEQKATILDGFDYLRIGRFTDPKWQTRYEEILDQLRDPNTDQIRLNVQGGMSIPKAKIKWNDLGRSGSSTLGEAKLMKLDQIGLQVWHNPTESDLIRLLEKFKDLRGLADGRQVWVWNGFAAIHEKVYEQIEVMINSPWSLDNMTLDFYVTIHDQTGLHNLTEIDVGPYSVFVNPVRGWNRNNRVLNKLLRRDGTQISEAQFEQPTEVYHGTSSKFLRSILKNGLIPNSTQRVWDDSDFAKTDEYNISRKSHSGTYLTTNLGTATGAATNAKQKFGGRTLVVIAQISEQSTVSDEDDITLALKWAYGQMNREIFGQTDDAIDTALWAWMRKPDLKQQMIDVFVNAFNEAVKAKDRKPANYPLLANALYAYMMRIAAYRQQKYTSGVSWRRPLGDLDQDRPPITDPVQAEKNFHKMHEILSRKYPPRHRARGDFGWRTFRMMEPVGFRGANRIIGIVEFGEYRWDENHKLIVDPVILHYGKITESFLKQYREHKGEFPGAVDPNGNVLIRSHRIEETRTSINEALEARVYRNPSPIVVANLFKDVNPHSEEERVLKGLWNENTHELFLGHAFDYTHNKLGQRLGIDSDDERSGWHAVVIGMNNDGTFGGIVSFSDWNKNNVRFSDDPSHPFFHHPSLKKLPFSANRKDWERWWL